MKYEEAVAQLKYALKNQQSIRTGKLNKILQSMNISLKKDNNDQEIEYLKGEIKKLVQRINELKE